jgi:plastocyanin
VVTEDVVTGPGSTLQNVFVYVKDGLGGLAFPVPATPVVLEQRGCMYRPRVLGIRTGQTLEILNSDATLHNIHAVPMHNAEFNKAQQTRGFVSTHVFSTSEVMVPFKCDVHRWMNAWVGVMDHPFFAVTGPDGSFEITGLPPGTYTIEAVHEMLGRKTQTVTVAPRGTETAGFSFAIP